MPVFDRLAHLYDAVMPPARPGPLYDGLARADGPVETVLDVGGGTGRAARALEPTPVVVDAARGMLARARARGLGTVQADAGGLPVADASVDGVMIVDALHHFPDATAALEAAAAALRPGGVLVIREFDPGTVLGRLLVAGERVVGFDSTFHAPDELATLVGEAGLEATVLDRGFGYTVVGRRPRATPAEDAADRTTAGSGGVS